MLQIHGVIPDVYTGVKGKAVKANAFMSQVEGMSCDMSLGAVMSEPRGNAPRFVGQPIGVLSGNFAAGSMVNGEPGVPRAFEWGGKTWTVVGVVKAWKTYSPCRTCPRSGERYLRRHWFEVQTAEGPKMTIYFDRQPKGKGKAKERWWLFEVAGEEENVK